MRSLVVIFLHEPADTAAYMLEYLTARKIDFATFRCWEKGVVQTIPNSLDELVHCVPVEGKPHHFIPVSSTSIVSSEDGREGKPTSYLALSGVESFRIRGVASFGGSMSVNDQLPYFDSIRSLMRSCIVTRTPVIGHCLGGQLLSSALGGRVKPSENCEIGWWDIKVEEAEEAKDWFGGRKFINVFLIHTESFTIPSGARRIATGTHCTNQAFQVGDQFAIGMQFHPEVDERKVRALTAPKFPFLYTEEEVAAIRKEEDADEKENGSRACGEVFGTNRRISARMSPAAMTRDAIDKCLSEGRIELNRPIADSIYDTWCSGFLC
uniref:Glutamine amidotransferase domain-containing protein n=1 Tax=Trypanosoma congolense (strain IL3000) TaxID=1068625 RepID=G0UNA9_TRYCI|nr:conserved hypothetical protein [Trypanosoma congolense IL3000]